MKQQLLALVAALGLAVGGVTAQAADTVKIGLMAPLTGSWASEGQGMKKIVELLAEQQNARVVCWASNRGGDRGRWRRPAHRPRWPRNALTTRGVVGWSVPTVLR